MDHRSGSPDVGPVRLPDGLRYVVEACRGTPWDVELLDPFAQHLARVSDGRRFFLTGGGALQAFPLNAAGAVSVAADKAHAAAVLRRAGLPVPAGEHFFLTPAYREVRPPGRELADALRYAEGRGFPLFVKPNSASRGAFARIVRDPTELVDHLVAMGRQHLIGLIQEVVAGDEYRFFLLDGEVRFAHRKQRTADQRGNLAAGAAPVDLVTRVDGPVAAFCRRAALALGLRVCGMDVVARTGGRDPLGFVILEVNGNPGLTALEKLGRLDLCLSLWREIMQRHFTGAGWVPD